MEIKKSDMRVWSGPTLRYHYISAQVVTETAETFVKFIYGQSKVKIEYYGEINSHLQTRELGQNQLP